MLSGEALDVAFTLRAQTGPLTQGDGPTLAQLRTATGLAEGELEGVLDELERIGFVAIDRSLPDATVAVLAPLQIYLDDLENQGSDDF